MYRELLRNFFPRFIFRTSFDEIEINNERKRSSNSNDVVALYKFNIRSVRHDFETKYVCNVARWSIWLMMTPTRAHTQTHLYNIIVVLFRLRSSSLSFSSIWSVVCVRSHRYVPLWSVTAIENTLMYFSIVFFLPFSLQ